MTIRQLFHIKSVCKNVENQHVYNRHMDFMVPIIELLRFLHCIKCIWNHHSEFEVIKKTEFVMIKMDIMALKKVQTAKEIIYNLSYYLLVFVFAEKYLIIIEKSENKTNLRCNITIPNGCHYRKSKEQSVWNCPVILPSFFLNDIFFGQ